MSQQIAVPADNDLEAKWQCYICRGLFRTKGSARTHFLTVHHDLDERFQPERVARVWCQKDTGRVARLAPLQRQTPSFQGIAPELRGLIFDHVLSLPWLAPEWPNPRVLPLHPESFALLSVNRDSFNLAKEALRRKNFFILFKVHGQASEPLEDALRQLLEGIELIVPRNVAEIMDPPALEVNIFLHEERYQERSSITSVLTLHSATAMNLMLERLFIFQSSIHLINVDFQLAASQPRHSDARNDIIRTFGYLQGVINLRIRDFALGFPSDIMRVPGQPLEVSGNIDLILSIFDRLLHDIIAARRAGRNYSAMQASMFGLSLVGIFTRPRIRIRVNWRGHALHAIALRDIECQLHLLYVQTVNTGMWQAICSRRPEQINVQALQTHIVTAAAYASGFSGLSTKHRAQAYLAKGVAFVFLANLLVRSGMRVDLDHYDGNDNYALEVDNHLLNSFWGVLVFSELPMTGNAYLRGPRHMHQVSSPRKAFTRAAKYLTLAAELLEGPSRARAADLADQIEIQGRVTRCEVDFRCWGAQNDPTSEVWLGDGLEWQIFEFDLLDNARMRPAGWQSRVTSEDGYPDMELSGLGISPLMLAAVCALC